MKVSLTLRSFDPNSRIITASAVITVLDTRLLEAIQRQGLGLPFSVNGENFVSDFRYLQPTDPIEYRAQDLELSLTGDPTSYPFDDYRGLIDVGVIAPQDYQPKGEFDSAIIPADIQVLTLLPGFETAITPDSKSSPNGVYIGLYRTSFDQIAFVLSLILYLGLILLAVVLSFTDFALEHRLALILGIAAIGVSLPGVRDLLVRDEVTVKTEVDVYLLFPFLVGSLLMLVVLIVRYLIGSHDKR